MMSAKEWSIYQLTFSRSNTVQIEVTLPPPLPIMDSRGPNFNQTTHPPCTFYFVEIFHVIKIQSAYCWYDQNGFEFCNQMSSSDDGSFNDSPNLIIWNTCLCTNCDYFNACIHEFADMIWTWNFY